jgi:hypothetical protein
MSTAISLSNLNCFLPEKCIPFQFQSCEEAAFAESWTVKTGTWIYTALQFQYLIGTHNQIVSKVWTVTFPHILSTCII